MFATTDLRALLTLDRTDEWTFQDPYLFKGTPAENQRTFGGQVLAQAIMAASQTVPDDRTCHSMHAYFLRPGSNAASITYQVEPTRDGRTFSQRRVTALQGGSTRFVLTASFHIAEAGLEHSDPMPPTPGPDECPSLGEVLRERFGSAAEQWIAWQGLEVRYAGDSSQFGGPSHSTHMRVWVRTIDPLGDDARMQPALAAYMSDLTILSAAALPHRVAILSPQVEAASLDHAMWFHRPIRADQWLLHDQISPSASGALGFSSGRIFQDGVLRATASQEGLIRLREQD